MALLRKLFTIVSAACAVLALAPGPHLHADNVIPGRYIVTLKSGIEMEKHITWANDIHTRSQDRRDMHTGVSHQYSIQEFRAYAGAFDDATIGQINKSDDVALVEPSTVWSVVQTNQTGLSTQTNATWGLGCISHKQATSLQYVYDPRGGSGTYAYIIDTGLLTTHAEFGNRAFSVYNAAIGSTSDDNVGHGTHIAGTIGSLSYGVAKQTTLLSVKVLDSEAGTDAQVMDGYTWAVNNITAEGRQASSVISMSIGGMYSQAFNDMVEAAYNQGITTVVAAGNYGQSANLTSPASSPNAITVGAIAANFSRPAWSDYGETIDIFAPGVNVLSTWTGSNSAVTTLSGTSMSAPHVSGLVLYLKSIMSNLDTPDAVASKIKELATSNLVQNPGLGSPNVIAYNGNGA